VSGKLFEGTSVNKPLIYSWKLNLLV